MWKRWLRGNALFKIQDADETLLNKLKKFHLRDIERHENCINFSVDLISKNEIIKILGKRTFSVTDNKNIFTLLNFLKLRPLFVIGATACLCLISILSNFAFKIRIDGVEGAERTEIMSYLKEHGVTRFTLKNAKNARTAAHGIVEKFDYIAHANAKINGSAIVFTVLRAENATDIEYSDIVSTGDGVITRIILLSGTALVSIGDVVRIGDVLVMGARPIAIIEIHNGKELVCVINNTNVQLNHGT